MVAMATDSPKMVNPRRKPRQSPRAVFAQNQAHLSASADVSEQLWKMNYKTQTHNKIHFIKVHV